MYVVKLFNGVKDLFKNIYFVWKMNKLSYSIKVYNIFMFFGIKYFYL